MNLLTKHLVAALACALAACSDAREPEVPSALDSDSHARMVDALAEILEVSPAQNPYVGTFEVERLSAELAELGEQAESAAAWPTRFALADALLALGREDEALDQLAWCHERLPEVRGRLGGRAHYFLLRYGVARLRQAETWNCCRRYTVESCVLPIRGAGLHTRTEPAAAAVELFLELLAEERLSPEAVLSARWLLNVAAMTLGRHPEGLPEEHVIPLDGIVPESDFPRFASLGPALGLDTVSLAGGAIGDDFDGDGYLDLVVSSSDPAQGLRFFRNDADGGFRDASSASGLDGILGGLNCLQADYDGDGNLDVLVLRGGWLQEEGRHPSSLLAGDGEGGFRDVAFEVGIAGDDYPTQTAGWADFDRDGDLDLYVGNETRGLLAPSQLFVQEDGRFRDVATIAGVSNNRFAKAVAWGDADGDGWPDLFVSNLGAANRLYVNRRDGTLFDEARSRGVEAPRESFPAWFWDPDNDGDLDLYVAAYSATIADLAADALGLVSSTERAAHHVNDGSGHFEDRAAQVGLARPAAPMGANFGDLDGDGWLDVFLGTGEPDYAELMPNQVYRSVAGERFVDVTRSGGFGNIQKGHAVVLADFDADGDSDVFQQMGGAYAGDAFADSFYANPGSGRRWLALDLVGTDSPRTPFGARIEVTFEEDGRERRVFRTYGSGGSFGASSLRQTIGLGAATRVRSVAVTWPRSGETELYEDVPLDAHLRVVEGGGAVERLELEPLTLAVRREG